MKNKSNEINLDVIKKGLGLEQDKNTIFFSNESIIVLSPSAQNNAWWFDILLNNANKVRESNKKGLLILRLFNDLLVADLEDFFEKMITEETVVLPKTKQPNWKFNAKSEGGNFYIVNNKNPRFKYTVKKLSVEQLKEEVQRIKGKKVPLPKFNFQETHSNIEQEADNEELIENINSYIHEYLINKGFHYSDRNVANFYLSLRSKPFVILSGISGTGKTKIVQLFAEAVGATHENGRYSLIPVRPDWSDSSDLIGYKDVKNDYIKGPLTKMIISATDNPNYPHFVVLDEMNLARVEYYLSDYLSVIESRDWNGDAITTVLITEFEENQKLKKYGLPDNLYIIGTVNMDETTHPFSKKVLDRANTIEFNEVDLLNFSIFEEQGEDVTPIEVSNDVFKSKYIQLKDVYNEYKGLVVSVSEELVSINQKLEKIYAHVGYRVRDEIVFYMAYNEEYQLMDRNQAMDYCIMQKILPRISGTGAEIEDVLKELFELFVRANDATPISIDSNEELTSIAKYPLSANKLREMNKRYRSLGFVSFWIS